MERNWVIKRGRSRGYWRSTGEGKKTSGIKAVRFKLCFGRSKIDTFEYLHFPCVLAKNSFQEIVLEYEFVWGVLPKKKNSFNGYFQFYSLFALWCHCYEQVC